MWKIDSQGNLISLTDTPASGRAGIWVPSEQVGFHRVELPPGRQRTWAQAVPFILEERLVDSVENQHFVIGRSGTGQGEQVPVAVVSMALMGSWAESWIEKGIVPQVVCLDLLAVPLEEGKAVLWHEGGRCLLRVDAQTGFSGSPEWMQSLLELGSQRDAVVVYSDDASALGEKLRKRAQALPCSLDDRMRMGFDQHARSMNLLQGAFRPASALASLAGSWKWAGAAAVMLAVAYIASLSMQMQMLNATTASLRQATATLYQQNFQDQVSPGALRSQVGRRMSQLREGVASRDASSWKMLGYVDPALSACKACRIEEINLEESALSLLLSSSQDIDPLLQQLASIGRITTSSEQLQDSGDRKQWRLRFSVTPEA